MSNFEIFLKTWKEQLDLSLFFSKKSFLHHPPYSIVPPFGLYIFLDDKDIFTYDNAAIHQINRERVVRRNWKMREGENQPASCSTSQVEMSRK